MILGCSVSRHGDGVLNRHFIPVDLDSLDDVAYQRLALGDGARLEELAEIGDVPLDLGCRRQFGSALLELANGVVSGCGQLILLLSEFQDSW